MRNSLNSAKKSGEFIEASWSSSTRILLSPQPRSRDHILARKAEVEKLVGVIGNLGVTSGYQKSANTAVFTARVWQTITVTALMGLIYIAYVAFLPLVHGEFIWSGFAGRVFVSLTVAVLAAYSASQADRYQKLERSNRRLALELEAIGPFICAIAP